MAVFVEGLKSRVRLRALWNQLCWRVFWKLALMLVGSPIVLTMTPSSAAMKPVSNEVWSQTELRMLELSVTWTWKPWSASGTLRHSWGESQAELLD